MATAAFGHRHCPLLDLNDVRLIRLVLLKFSHKPLFVQVRFQSKNFLGYLLVVALDPFQLLLPKVEMQAFAVICRLQTGHRCTLSNAPLWPSRHSKLALVCRIFASRYLN